MPLIEKLNELIATRTGARPEDITAEFIRRCRKARKVILDHTNDYGGRCSDGLQHLTDEEVESAKEAFEDMVTTTKE
jgi:hypothetical protein